MAALMLAEISNLVIKFKEVLMSIRKHSGESTISNLCSSCQSFYGSEVYLGLCSGCHKKLSHQKKQQIPTPTPVEVSIEPQPELKKEEEPVKEEAIQVDKKKCFSCKKKVGLLGTECKCSFVYCNAHRLPQSHSCSFDFRAKGQKDLQKTIVKVSNGKIAQI